MELDKIESQAADVTAELIEVSGIGKGEVLVVGCSSSEVQGIHIGRDSNVDVAEAIYKGISRVTEEKGIYIAAQCCEHLNRAIIIEKAALQYNAEIVNVVPHPKAGGSFATAVYSNLKEPVAVEEIKADAGIDIGKTLIGMHLKRVAVPIRLSVSKIGKAEITCARTRPKYIGGERALYDAELSGGEIAR